MGPIPKTRKAGLTEIAKAHQDAYEKLTLPHTQTQLLLLFASRLISELSQTSSITQKKG